MFVIVGPWYFPSIIINNTMQHETYTQNNSWRLLVTEQYATDVT